MAVDTAAKRYAAATFGVGTPLFPDGTIDTDDQVSLGGGYPVTFPTVEETTPILEMATRSPKVVAGAFPTEAPYIEAVTLAGAALLEHTTAGSDGLDFVGSFRVEFDVALPDDGTNYVLIEAVDTTSGRTTVKVTVAGTPTRAVTFVIDDGATTETHVFYATAVGRAAGAGSRIAVAAGFDVEGGVSVETAVRTDTSNGLASAAWIAVGSATSNLTAIETPVSTRRWRIDLGTDRARIIEARVLSGTTQVGRVFAANVGTPAATHTAGGVTWSVDSGAVLRARGDWDDITSLVRIPSGGISCRRGRNSDQGLHLAGELSATLDNRSRQFEPGYTGSPYYPAVRPLTPIRWCAQHSGVTYPLFRGYARRFLPSYPVGENESTAALEAVDAFRVFTIFDTGLAIGTAIDALTPVAVWPMTDTGATLDDTTGTNHLTPTSLSQGYGSPFWGDRRKVASFDGSTSLAQDTAADTAVEITGDCSVVFVTRNTPGGDYHIVSAYGTAGCYWGVELDCATAQTPILRWIRNDGTPTSAGNDISLSSLDYGHFSDGKPHVVVVTYDQSEDTCTVYTDGTQVGQSVDAVPAGNGTPTVAGTATIRVAAEGTHGSGTASYEGLLGYLAVYNKVLSSDQALALTRSTIDGFAASTPSQRVTQLLDAYPWPPSARVIDSATTIEPATPLAVLEGTVSSWYAGSAFGVTITVAAPAEASIGATLYAGIAMPGHRTISTVPTGWTEIVTSASGSTSSDVIVYLYRFDSYDGSESWDFERSSDSGVASYACMATLAAATATATNSGTSTALVANTVTAAAGDLLLTFHATLSTTTTLTSTTPPAGMVEIADENSSYKSSVQRANLAVNALADLTAGATGTKTATRTASEAFATITLLVAASGAASAAGSMAAKDMADGSLLAELQAVADAELGEVFIDSQGRPNFRGRDWRTTNSAAVSATFGDSGAELNYSGVTFSYDEDRILNEITVTDADGNTATAIDATSRDLYGRRHHAETVDLTGTTAPSTHAAATLAAYKDPRLLVRALSVFPAGDPVTVFPVVLGLGLGDRIAVRRRPPGWTSGGYIDRETFVEAFTVSVERGIKDWHFTYTGSPAT